jgi:hypothetical protein
MYLARIWPQNAFVFLFSSLWSFLIGGVRDATNPKPWDLLSHGLDLVGKPV